MILRCISISYKYYLSCSTAKVTHFVISDSIFIYCLVLVVDDGLRYNVKTLYVGYSFDNWSHILTHSNYNLFQLNYCM